MKPWVVPKDFHFTLLCTFISVTQLFDHPIHITFKRSFLYCWLVKPRLQTLGGSFLSKGGHLLYREEVSKLLKIGGSPGIERPKIKPLTKDQERYEENSRSPDKCDTKPHFSVKTWLPSARIETLFILVSMDLFSNVNSFPIYKVSAGDINYYWLPKVQLFRLTSNYHSVNKVFFLATFPQIFF